MQELHLKKKQKREERTWQGHWPSRNFSLNPKLKHKTILLFWGYNQTLAQKVPTIWCSKKWKLHRFSGSRLKTFKTLKMTLFLEKIQDRLSSHIGKNRSEGGIGIFAMDWRKKSEWRHGQFHLLELSVLLTRACCWVYLTANPKIPPKRGDQAAQGNNLWIPSLELSSKTRAADWYGEAGLPGSVPGWDGQGLENLE